MHVIGNTVRRPTAASATRPTATSARSTSEPAPDRLLRRQHRDRRAATIRPTPSAAACRRPPDAANATASAVGSTSTAAFLSRCCATRRSAGPGVPRARPGPTRGARTSSCIRCPSSLKTMPNPCQGVPAQPVVSAAQRTARPELTARGWAPAESPAPIRVGARHRPSAPKLWPVGCLVVKLGSSIVADERGAVRADVLGADLRRAGRAASRRARRRSSSPAARSPGAWG